MRLCKLIVLTVAALGLVVAVMPAAETSKPEPPTTSAARAARKKLDTSLAKADEARRVAYLAAHRQYLREMQTALRAAANGGKADEVARIATEVERAGRRVKELAEHKAQDAKPKTGRVLSTNIWQPVLRVKKGQVLRITAAGTWHVSPEHTCGPDGLRGHWVANNKPSGLLIARIGKQTFDVGLEAEITVPATGVLEMSCNGGDASQEEDDYLDVTIVVGTGDGD